MDANDCVAVVVVNKRFQRVYIDTINYIIENHDQTIYNL